MIETRLPNEQEHRRRVEARTADIPGHRMPTWDEVQSDGWIPGDEERDGPRILIDTTDAEVAAAQALAGIRAHHQHTL